MRGSFERLAELTESELADVYLAAEPVFPYVDRSGGWVSPRDNAREFVQGIPRRLEQRGTAAAVAELERIVAARPDLEWIKRSVLVNARKRCREVSWEPPTIDQVREFISSHGERAIVRSEVELLRACRKALRIVEDNLQGRNGGTPLAFLLWDDARPKEENRMSDYLATELRRFLERKAVLANREVQIRPSRLVPEHAPKGQQTDILVQAVPLGGDEPITVVVEVKGCWHKEVKEAMETQLVNRYLLPNGFRYGLYLVVWCKCASWASEDSRKSSGSFRSIEEAREFLEGQAAALSKDEVHVEALVLDARLA